ncbi:MAG: hypothetical protein MUF38_12955 [Anaerolineae bacterium]|jgi:hypothetical protein|nr:hypothetical protein [Anaerolineae bacterium]
MGSNRRRSTSNRSRSSSTSRSGYGRKTLAEARIEHITWALLVGVFAIIYLARDTELAQQIQIPNWFAPVAGALILLGSGFYQYAQGWRVSPATWVGGSLMFVAAYYGLYMNPGRDLNGIVLLVFAGVIGFGVVTGET